MSRQQMLTSLVDVIRRSSRARPLRVAIDGRSAAGKSTMADELVDRLAAEGRPCLRASIDDFHPPGYKQRVVARAYTHSAYLEDGFDYDALRGLVLEPLAPRGSRRCRLKLWNSFEDQPFPADWVTVTDETVLIVDGVFLQLPQLRDAWDFAIWLDVSWETMLQRAEQRDLSWAGSVALIRELYRDWIPRHRLYEEAVGPRELADVVIDNNDVENPHIVQMRRSENALTDQCM